MQKAKGSKKISCKPPWWLVKIQSNFSFCRVKRSRPNTLFPQGAFLLQQSIAGCLGISKLDRLSQIRGVWGWFVGGSWDNSHETSTKHSDKSTRIYEKIIALNHMLCDFKLLKLSPHVPEKQNITTMGKQFMASMGPLRARSELSSPVMYPEAKPIMRGPSRISTSPEPFLLYRLSNTWNFTMNKFLGPIIPFERYKIKHRQLRSVGLQ